MVLVPLLVGLMWAIHVHYRRLELAVAPRSTAPVSVPARSPLVIVPIARLDQPSLDAIAFARSIAPDALAVHITNDADGRGRAARSLVRAGRRRGAGDRRVAVPGPDQAAAALPGRAAGPGSGPPPAGRPVRGRPAHWWDNFLHNQTALRLKLRLFFRPNTIVADVPYHLPQV